MVTRPSRNREVEPVVGNERWPRVRAPAKASSRTSARSDFPLPDGPRSITPVPARTMPVPWTFIVRCTRLAVGAVEM